MECVFKSLGLSKTEDLKWQIVTKYFKADLEFIILKPDEDLSSQKKPEAFVYYIKDILTLKEPLFEKVVKEVSEQFSAEISVIFMDSKS